MESMNKTWRSIEIRTLGRQLSYKKTNSNRWVVADMEVDIVADTAEDMVADMVVDTAEDTAEDMEDSDNGIVMAIDSSKQYILILLSFV
jgi:hypothetical protein